MGEDLCDYQSPKLNSALSEIVSLVKVLANEDKLLRAHCCRLKCFPVCPGAQHLLRTQKCF